MPDQPATQPPELLTLPEAADLLRTPIATLRYWRHLGTGPRSLKIGRHVLYRRDDLHTWINAQHEDGDRSALTRPSARAQGGPPVHRLSAGAPTVHTTTSRR